MAIVLFENTTEWASFSPLTLTQPFAKLQLGILNMQEWWEKLTGEKVYIYSAAYLQEQLPSETEEVILINAFVLPNEKIWQKIQSLNKGIILTNNNQSIATKGIWGIIKNRFYTKNKSETISIEAATFIHSPYLLLQLHQQIIEQQFALVTKNRNTQKISNTNNVIAPENIFLEEGVEIEYATLNANKGYIYLGKNTTVMEGCMIRGALALGENSVIKMGSKIYGATSTGKKCTLGGEIKNTIFNHCSNKGHDGYLGDSIIGNWCNFGAGSSNSNLKNTASTVSLYNYANNAFEPVGYKMGLLMGDYTRIAINSSINTGSSFGACSNVFGNGILPKLIHSFIWGIDKATEKYQFEKALQHIQNWMQLKQEQLSDKEISILQYIFEHLEN